MRGRMREQDEGESSGEALAASRLGEQGRKENGMETAHSVSSHQTCYYYYYLFFFFFPVTVYSCAYGQVKTFHFILLLSLLFKSGYNKNLDTQQQNSLAVGVGAIWYQVPTRIVSA